MLRGLIAAMLLLPAFLQAQVSVTVTGTNITCNGQNNGTATAIASGGWAPYTYQWSTGATTQTITGLAAGTYFVTVTDIDLGYAIGSITISQPPLLGVQVYGESQICGIVPDGKATAVPFGGTPPYTYHWSNGGTTAQITGLPAGTYTVTVTDLNNCTATGSATVYFWNEGVWIMDSTVNVTCFGYNNGFVHVSGMSGTPPYSYTWNTGQTGPNLFNLSPGTYTVTVSDVNGCSNSHTVTVTQPTPVVVATSSTAGTCGLSGSATVTASGGTPPYSILWNTGATTPTITVPAGTYTATITDAKGCSKPATVTVTSTPNTLTVNAQATSNAGCTVGGSANASAFGGSGNYSYSWSGGLPATQSVSNVPAGTYTVTVVDIATGCTGTASTTVTSAPQLGMTTTVITNATCLTGGSATANPSGGTPPYTFVWDNNPALNTQTVSNLTAGPHSVKVTDSKGCVATAGVTIGQSQGPTVTATVNNNATCTTGGKATATATGGSGNYVYLWSANAGSATTQVVANLPAGTYTVTVTDSNGCSASASVSITQTGAPTAVITSSSGSACSTGGSATAGATGGSGNYTYKWNNPAMSMTATVTNLGPGTYTVTVTDQSTGCTATAVVSIASAIPPNVVITASANATCSQLGSATAVATSGGGGYVYFWSSGATTATATNLPPGVNTVTVTDANGCTATASVTIGQTNNGIKIGDYVWYDNDQDGFQHALETAGVVNVTVKLMKAGNDGIFYTPDDVTVATTTTNASGLYLFDCVPPGTFYLMFNGIPSGYQWTGKDKVNNDCLDSDVNANGKTDPFTIISGQSDNFCFDAGIHTPCSNVMFPGIICCDQTICEGQTPAPFYQVQAPSGGSGPFEYQWLQLVNQGQSGPVWVAVPGANGPTYQPGPLFETTKYMRCVRRQGCINMLESNIVKITVLPAGTPGCEDFIQDMSVNPNGANGVIISWTTIPEAIQYLYTVEHSMDGQSWTKVTSVMGLKDASAPNHYEAVDQTPANGKNFYRIKRSSAFGADSYSKTLSIDLAVTGVDAIAIFPNPATDVLFVRNMIQFDADVQVLVTSVKGDILYSASIPQGEIQQLDIPLDNVAQGIYLVRLKFGDGSQKTLKVAKF